MLVIKESDPTFKRNLEVAIDLGKAVLIEALEEEVDVHIESLIKKRLVKFGDT